MQNVAELMKPLFIKPVNFIKLFDSKAKTAMIETINQVRNMRFRLPHHILDLGKKENLKHIPFQVLPRGCYEKTSGSARDKKKTHTHQRECAFCCGFPCVKLAVRPSAG